MFLFFDVENVSRVKISHRRNIFNDETFRSTVDSSSHTTQLRFSTDFFLWQVVIFKHTTVSLATIQ